MKRIFILVFCFCCVYSVFSEGNIQTPSRSKVQSRNNMVPLENKEYYVRLLDELPLSAYNPEWKCQAVSVFMETQALLQKFQAHGFTYKQVIKVEGRKGCPAWSNGKLIFPLSDPLDVNDLGYIAHEMGHGFHEKLREDKGYKDIYGEDWAESIRFFVEKRMKTNRKSRSVVLEACNFDEDKFISMLENGELKKRFGIKMEKAKPR